MADPPKDPNVEEWLRRIGLTEYVETFHSHNITWDVLPLMTIENSAEIIKNFGDRLRLAKGLEELKSASSACTSDTPHSPVVHIDPELLKEINECDFDVTFSTEDITVQVPSAKTPEKPCSSLHSPEKRTPEKQRTPEKERTPVKQRTPVKTPLKGSPSKRSPKKNVSGKLIPLTLTEKVFAFNSELLTDRDLEKLKKPFLEFLEKDIKGQSLKALFEGKPDNQDRQHLSDLIITHELSESCNPVISAQRFKQLALSIYACFPAENPRTYYIPQVNLGLRQKINARGKLYHSYLSKRKYYRKSGFLEKHKRSKEAPSSEAKPPAADDLEIPVKEEDIIYLQHTTGDEFEILQEKWQNTSKYRLNLLHKNKSISIHEYMKLYSSLLKGYAGHLISIDLQTLHPTKVNCLQLVWPGLISKLFELAKSKGAKDKAYRKFITSVIPAFNDLENLSKEEQLFYSLQILPSLITPGTKPCEKVEGLKSGVIRFSRKEVHDDFLVHIPRKEDLRVELQRRNEKLSQLKLKSEPVPVLVGDPEHLACYVEINDTLYSVKSPLDAVDIAFKAIFVFDAAYSIPSEKVWIFLEKFIYRLSDLTETRAIKSKRSTTSDIECLAGELGLVRPQEQTLNPGPSV